MITDKECHEVLLIEDNLAQAVIVEEALRLGQDNVKLRVLPDADEALKFLHDPCGSAMPAFIFLDLHLPKKSGFEFLKEIKDDPLLKDIPVAVLTSSTREEDIQEAYALHANCYLEKPLDFEEFVSLIKSIEKLWLRS